MFPHSLDMPPNDETTVALVTGSLGQPLDGIARHPWFAVRKKGEDSWATYEVGGGGTRGRSVSSPQRVLNPQVEHVWRGAEAERAAACIEREAGT